MSLQGLSQSRFGVGLVLSLGKILPGRPGFWLADQVGKWIASLKQSEQVRTVRANQWVVSGGSLSKQQLDRAVQAVYRSTARCLFDLYHSLDHPEQISRRVELSPKLIDIFTKNQAGQGGILAVAPHLSNFDLAGQALGLRGWPFQILSFPQPGGGYQWQNKLRSLNNIEITPTSLKTLQQAKARLLRGGIVLTGLERPIGNSRYRPLFFGRPAPVPVAYIRLAMETHVPVVVVTCLTKPDGNYLINASEPIPMQSYPDLVEEMEQNASRVLAEAEIFIRQVPNQWSMFYPVWPEALNEVP
jgi:phosphatidylinositol dimannoside acyltransferase